GRYQRRPPRDTLNTPNRRDEEAAGLRPSCERRDVRPPVPCLGRLLLRPDELQHVALPRSSLMPESDSIHPTMDTNAAPALAAARKDSAVQGADPDSTGPEQSVAQLPAEQVGRYRVL